MASNDLRIILRAEDKASDTLKSVSKGVDAVSGSGSKAADKVASLNSKLSIARMRLDEANASGTAKASTLANLRQRVSDYETQLAKANAEVGRGSTLAGRLSDNWSTFAGISAASGVALYGLYGQVERANEAANRLQSSLTGLNSVARAFNQDATAAKRAAQDLAEDGLMTVADAATGLKNLLAAGFSLDQAITLMKRFKDSAAFGRQSALSFGQAVSSATEGIKNGNSILVDNAGVTKNLSIMLEEAGYSAQDLMKASSDAGIRQAIFNGILRETNAQLGDADRLTQSAAGKQAMMAAETEKLYQQIGIALQPAILSLLQTVTPLIVGLAGWVEQNPQLAAGIVIVTGSLLALSTMVGAVATAITAAKVVAATFGPTVAGSVAIGQAAFTAFKALVMTPLFMPAIGIAAVIASLVAVQQEARKTLAVLDEVADAQRIEAESYNDAHRKLLNLKKNGTPEQKARAIEAGRRLGMPGFALGTAYAPDGDAIVGEHGPERVTLPQGARVTPAWQTRSQGVSAASGGISLNFYGPVAVREESDLERLAQRVASLIDQGGQALARGGTA